MNTKVTATIEMDFEVSGAKFRIYRNILWADGGEYDDMVIRDLEDECGEIEDYETTFELEITEKDIKEAKDYQEYLEEDAS